MRLYILLFSFIPLFFPFLSSAQEWQWAKSLGDTTGNTMINALNRHYDQNILIAGQYDCKTLQLGDFTLNNKGRNDIFIAVGDPSGNVLWAQSFGGTSDESASCIASDRDGNIYFAGQFNSLSVTFGTYTLINKGESDGYLVKVSQDKSVEWAIAFETQGYDYITGLATDNNGSVYLTGYTVDYGMNESRVFTARVNGDNSIAWQRKGISGSYGLSANAIALDQNNNCYVTGSFSTEMIFEGNHRLSTPEWESAAFVVKYTTNGDYVSSALVDGFTRGTGILCHDDGLFISGDSINYGMGWGWPLAHSKIFLARTGPDLKPVWLRKTGGIVLFQSLDITESLSADEEGNLYLSGTFFSPGFMFGSDSLENLFNEEYYYQQAFIIKYDPDGNEIWGKVIGDSLCDGATAILAVGNDRLFVAGFYESGNITIYPHVLENNGYVRSVYVHLRPPRHARNALSFLANYSDLQAGKTEAPVPGMRIYPNPARDFFCLQFDRPLESPGRLEMYAPDGRIILSRQLMPGESLIEINAGHIPGGMYLIKMNVGQLVTTYKIIRN